MTRSLAVLLLLGIACTSAPPPPPAAPPAAPAPVAASALQDRYGDSTETAVPVPAQGDEVDFENNWLYDRFGRFRRLKFAVAHQNDRHYDIITIELPDHAQHTVYFDITDLWAAWGKK
ncbi:MAG TPA: hypothetical protein VII75_16970 [Thermoanaerobaculia bacterium]|nr:hypothetical protein [Thermoanaerobaculia bacterium]